MTYDTSGIQQEGGQGYFGQEESVWTVEPRKGKRGPQGIKRSPIDCPCCGKSFIIRPGASLKTRFCSIKCGSNNRPKDILANEKRKCMTCHALIGMTGAASGRMVNLPKGVVCVFRNKNKLPVFSRSQAAVIAAARLRGRPLPWWGDLEAGMAWMSQIRVKDFDWSSVWTNELKRRKAQKYIGSYYKMTNEEKAEHNRKTWRKRKERYRTDADYAQHRKRYSSGWKKKNPEKNRASVRESLRKRKAIDPGFKVQCNLRHRLKEIMGRVKKGGTEHRNNLTGCTTKELAKHLESGFTKRMSWANYGTYWHVDHIIPCASFDHTDPKQRAQCWHWTNLRPLEARANMIKSDAITEPQMSLLLCAG